MAESGSFLLEAGWYDGDPMAGGTLAFAAIPASRPYQATVVPEPATTSLLSLGLLGVAAYWRRRRN